MPFGPGCANALKFTLNLLEEFEFSVKNLDNYCGYGEIGDGELFGVLGHLDVVPVGNDWTYPPFDALLIDGKIYGRGAIDDKGPTIVSIFAAAKLMQDGYIPKKRLRFILGCDEESGWKCMEHYSLTEEIPTTGFSPDADFPCINCEKGIIHYLLSMPVPNDIIDFVGGTRSNVVPDRAMIVVNPKFFKFSTAKQNPSVGLRFITNETLPGQLIKILAEGRSAHASTPNEGENAIVKLLYAISQENSQLATLANAFAMNDGSNCGLNFSDLKSGALTLNLGTVKIVNKRLVFELDIRYPVTIKKSHLKKTLQENLAFVKIEELDGHPPLYVNEEDPLVKSLLNAYDRVMFTNSKPLTIGGGTYARFLPHGVAFGPSFPNSVSLVHQKDEFISIQDLALTFDIYYEALKQLVF
jgi:succinyl-diaminopimelate desuccinylase